MYCHDRKVSRSGHTSQAVKMLMEDVECKVDATESIRHSRTPWLLWPVVPWLPSLTRLLHAPAEESSRKAEIQVKMGRTRSAPHALYNSLKILIRLQNELESKASSQLSYGSGGNLLCHSNALAIYSAGLCQSVIPFT